MSEIEAAVCWPCVVGLHEECMAPVLTDTEDIEQPWVKCCCFSSKVPEAQTFVHDGPGRPLSDPSEITDAKSTGRKRAAAIAPILDGMLCEWAGLARAGGGIYPIVGCRGNTISETKTGPHAGHRHHGPNKNTLDNTPGVNLHRICTTCHNRWHALNNKTYAGERPPANEPWYPEGEWQKHDPVTQATEEDYEESDIFWSKNKIDRKIDTDD